MKWGTILMLSLLYLSNGRRASTNATVSSEKDSNATLPSEKDFNMISSSEKTTNEIPASEETLKTTPSSRETTNTIPTSDKTSETKADVSERCGPMRARQAIVITDKEGIERTLVCLEHKNKYMWTELDKFFSSLGEHVNPGQSCSHIAEKNSEAKNGYYWIDSEDLNNKTKVWCDFTTGTGGFMLIGYANSPVSWELSSNDETVSPFENPHWSSSFGRMKITEFRVQVSSSASMKDTKADWLYHFSSPRLLSELFINNHKTGGCSVYYPGIGNVEYVEDLVSDVVATTSFNCSQFGPSYPSELGWQKMNDCFRKPCKQGFAYLRGDSTRYDNYGSFSYSSMTATSGLIDSSTAFVGCEHGQCCACYGPRGEKGNFCSPPCKPINGGTVLKNAHVWFWARTSLPRQPVWNKCVEFVRKTKTGTMETYFINGKTGIITKGSCTQKGVPNVIDGVIKINKKENLKDIPPVEGLLSYSKDVKKLYLSNGQNWNGITTDEQVTKIDKLLSNRIKEDEKKMSRMFNELKQKTSDFEAMVTDLEKKLETSGEKNFPKSCKDIKTSNPNSTSGVYWIKPIRSRNHNAFGAYCDMITEGGGWTLVYSYRFTNFTNFFSKTNAVTPRPNWSVKDASVPVSTSPPLNEWSPGAVDYNLWHKIGNDFMVKSTINDWIACKPIGGSLVVRRNGYISCKNIKNVATKCTGIVPIKIAWHKYGPFLSASSVFYDFEHNSQHDWPAHDPCGKRRPDHKKGVINPGGAIFVR